MVERNTNYKQAHSTMNIERQLVADILGLVERYVTLSHSRDVKEGIARRRARIEADKKRGAK